MLGATLDNKLYFATHLLNTIKNANKKFNTLTRVQKYMTTDQQAYILSNFLINRNLLTVRWYGCFVQNVPFVEQTIFMGAACALYSKTSDLNLK